MDACNKHPDLLFRRQFLAGPAPVCFRESWKVANFAELYVSTHPDLEISTTSRGQISYLCLGHVLDPNNTQLDNNGVIQSLIDRCATFEDFERLASALGGRWLIFIKIGNKLRLYPDAGGTKSAFYAILPRGLWIASQPRLISEALGLPIDRTRLLSFLSGKYQNSWPGAVTPYANVWQLLPNHYLDINSGKTCRFWPRNPIGEVTVDDAVTNITSIIHDTIQSAQARRPLVMALTAGYDSRVLFACAGDLRQHLQLFTVQDPDTDYCDILIPKRIARRYDLKHHVLKTIAADENFLMLLKRNTSYMLQDSSTQKVYTLGSFKNSPFILSGQIAEVARCFYYKDGLHPGDVNGEYLAEISGYAGNVVAIESFENWLRDVPRNCGVNVLDLFYWEHRVGNWAAIACAARDMVCDLISPFNSRELLQVALGVNVAFRAAPCELFRELCERGAPKISSVPFNTSFPDRANSLIRRILPWRVWTRIQCIRMKRAGLSANSLVEDTMRELV